MFLVCGSKHAIRRTSSSSLNTHTAMGTNMLGNRTEPTLSVGASLYPKDYIETDVDVPASSDHILCFANSGTTRGEYVHDGGPTRSYTFSTNHWFIGPACENSCRYNYWQGIGEQPISTTVFRLPASIVEKTAAETLDVDETQVQLLLRKNIYDGMMMRLALAINAESKRSTPLGEVYKQTATQLLVIHLLQCHSAHHCKAPAAAEKLRGNRLHKVLDYIHDNLHHDLSLETMSQFACLSRCHFARSFRQSLGEAPHQYIVRCRLEKAKNCSGIRTGLS